MPRRRQVRNVDDAGDIGRADLFEEIGSYARDRSELVETRVAFGVDQAVQGELGHGLDDHGRVGADRVVIRPTVTLCSSAETCGGQVLH